MFLESQDSRVLVWCLSIKYSVLFQRIVVAVFVCLFLISIGKSLEAICGMDCSATCRRLRSGAGPREAEREERGRIAHLRFLRY